MSGIFPEPKVSATDALSLYKSPTAGEGTAGTLIKAARGRVYKVRAKIKAATAYTVMLFDKATAPINGDTPIWQFDVAANGDVAETFELWGLQFQNGIGIAISSTNTTLTLAVATDLLAKVLYA